MGTMDFFIRRFEGDESTLSPASNAAPMKPASLLISAILSSALGVSIFQYCSRKCRSTESRRNFPAAAMPPPSTIICGSIRCAALMQLYHVSYAGGFARSGSEFAKGRGLCNIFHHHRFAQGIADNIRQWHRVPSGKIGATDHHARISG